MDRRAWIAWVALPAGIAVVPLLAKQQAQEPRQERPTSEDDSIAPEFGGLVDELGKDEIRPRGSFETPLHLQSCPRLIARPDGGFWMVSLAWSPSEGDTLVTRLLDKDGTLQRPPPSIEIAGPSAADGTREVLRPDGIGDEKGRLVVAWTETTDAGPVLRMSRLEGAAFTPPVTLTEPSRAARNVALALHDGRVWCAFESWVPAAAGSDKGRVDVVLAPLEGEKLGKEIVVGDGRFTDLDARLASSHGLLWIAWSQYQGRDFEVLLRSFDAKSGQLGAPLDVSREAASDDLHPSLAAAPNGDLWLAWDRIVDPGRGRSLPATFVDPYSTEPCGVFVMSACVRGGHVLLPEGRRGLPAGVVVGAPRFSWTGGVPHIAIGSDGAPWLAYRYLKHGKTDDVYGYAVVAHRWDGVAWSTPVELAHSAGMPETPALVGMKSGAMLAWQRDHRLELGASSMPVGSRAKMTQWVEETRRGSAIWLGESAIATAVVTAVQVPGGVAPGAKLVERPDRMAPPHEHPSADPVADPYVTGARHFEVKRGGTTWRAYWGDLHRHTCVSRCSFGMEERPEQRWQLGRDVHSYDFMAITDHSGQLDAYETWLEDKLIRQQRTPDFLTLAAFEWSTFAYGHQNVILPGRLEPIVETNCDPETLYRAVAPAGAIAIPHTTANLGIAADLSRWDDVHTCLVEVYQALRGSCEFDGCWRQSKRAHALDCFVQDALDKGHKFGVIASTDHGNGCAYAVALATALDTKSLFEAFRARRTYGATTKGMLIDFRIDDHLMGEEVACAAPPHLTVHARGAAELAEVVIFRDHDVFAALGRDAARARPTPNVVVTMDLAVGPAACAAGADESLTLRAPGCTLQRDLGVLARVHREPGAPTAGWSLDTAGSVATFACPAAFTPSAAEHLFLLDVSGPVGAELAIAWGGETRTIALGELIQKPIRGKTPRGAFELRAREPVDACIDSEPGLGVRELDHDWTDATAGPGAHWYYARAVQRDGEVMWSSPIFVDRR